MKTIQISDEDYEFLGELQHELNTQTNDGNADPVYWGVMETREVGVPDGCGDARIYLGDGGTETLEGAVAYIAEYLVDDEDMEAWNEVDKTNIDAIVEFCREKLGMSEVRIVDVTKKSEISRYTGAFLTKRACKQYIDRYGYNHDNPHTYAMTAYRNFEFERLLKILKTMVLKEDEPERAIEGRLYVLKRNFADYKVGELFVGTAGGFWANVVRRSNVPCSKEFVQLFHDTGIQYDPAASADEIKKLDMIVEGIKMKANKEG